MRGRSFRTTVGLLLAVGVASMATWTSTTWAGPEDAIEGFVGSWGGTGEVRFADGKSEAITCRAYYTGGSGSELGLALRCASAAYKVEIRSKLAVAAGAVTGTWEERTFNAQGDVVGTLDGKRLALRVSGGAFEGDMTIDRTDDRQQVAVATRGINLSGVDVKLARLKE